MLCVQLVLTGSVLLAVAQLDANREIGEAAQGNAHAELAYTEYFGFISDAIASVQASCGVGIVIDVHGHAHPEGYVELGYARLVAPPLPPRHMHPSLPLLRPSLTLPRTYTDTHYLRAILR